MAGDAGLRGQWKSPSVTPPPLSGPSVSDTGVRHSSWKAWDLGGSGVTGPDKECSVSWLGEDVKGRRLLSLGVHVCVCVCVASEIHFLALSILASPALSHHGLCSETDPLHHVGHLLLDTC